MSKVKKFVERVRKDPELQVALGAAGLAAAIPGGIAAYHSTEAFHNEWSKKAKRERLKPGLYLGSRNVKIKNLPLGRHQFLVLIPNNPEKFRGRLKNLGNGNKGIVVGAYKTPSKEGTQRLRYSTRNRNDLDAVKSFFSNKNRGWKTELAPISLPEEASIDLTISNIMRRGENYRAHERHRKQMLYPSVLSNTLNRGVNSNSFITSLLLGEGLTEVPEMAGYDSGSHFRIPEEMFRDPEPLAKEAAAYFMAGYLSKPHEE